MEGLEDSGDGKQLSDEETSIGWRGNFSIPAEQPLDKEVFGRLMKEG